MKAEVCPLCSGFRWDWQFIRIIQAIEKRGGRWIRKLKAGGLSGDSAEARARLSRA